jgi:hypothetical protein
VCKKDLGKRSGFMRHYICVHMFPACKKKQVSAEAKKSSELADSPNPTEVKKLGTPTKMSQE